MSSCRACVTLLRYLQEARKSQLQRLTDWEKEINLVDYQGPAIKVENEVDLEGPPRHMKYITEYKVMIISNFLGSTTYTLPEHGHNKGKRGRGGAIRRKVKL